jgi:hypothetical protein
MAAAIFPGAVWMPGRNAGYHAGETAMRCVVHHYTVGVNSTGIGLDGYFHWLLPKIGPPLQFAEARAVTWHAGEWNDQGPGVELERLGDWEPATRDQTHWGGAIDAWLRAEHGVADSYYSATAPRIPEGFAGFLNHTNLIQSQMHVDYWSDDEVAAMRASTAPPPRPPRTITRSSEPMGHISFQIGDHYDAYRVDASGTVWHSWWPHSPRPGVLEVGREIIHRDAKAEGQISGTLQSTDGKTIARTDLWVERRDGELAHLFQSSTDWVWHLDGAAW